jgi:TonB family protein
MLFDLDDSRPDTPRVPFAISRREGVLFSFVAHGLFLGVLLFAPAEWWSSTLIPSQPVASRESVRYVDMRPAIERVAPPRPDAEHSDADRRSRTRERPPDATSPVPYSRGNTPEKVVGAPEEKPAGPPAASPPAPPADATATAPVTAKVLPDVSARPQASAGALGAALRDIRRFLQDDSLQSPKGGQGDKDPDIDFDSKGVEFGPWLRRFVAQVKRNWFVPATAYYMKGRVVITFYVHKNGTITDLKIISSSGIDSFDASSFNALRLSNPLQPLPSEYPLEKAFFTVTFHYNEGLD